MEKPTPPPFACARVDKKPRAPKMEMDKMEMGISILTSPSRASAHTHVREDFYGEAIGDDARDAAKLALEQTGGSAKYSSVWVHYCLKLGINTFMDELTSVMSCKKLGEIKYPARAFHSRLRKLADQIDRQEGGAK